MNKEQIYDEKISPLVAAVADLCEKHGIEMLANFFIPVEGNPSLQVTTSIPDEMGTKRAEHLIAFISLIHDRDMDQFVSTPRNAVQ